MSSSFSALYKNRKRIVWVEDELTRAYLRELWKEPDIEFFVAGGTGSVEAVVKASVAEGHANVCGIVDRDFQKSNRARWGNVLKHHGIFRTEAHEVECYLLDFEAFEDMGKRDYVVEMSSADWEQIAKKTAESSVWWMAARAMMWDIHVLTIHEFPAHPKLGNPPKLRSEGDAQAALKTRVLESDWLRVHAGSLQAVITEEWLSDKLNEHGERLNSTLQTDDWKLSWSGKELLKTELTARLRQKSKISESDVAMEVASYQRSKRTIPEELEELRKLVRPA